MIGYFPKNASAGDLLPMAKLSKKAIRGIAGTYGVAKKDRNRKASGCNFAPTAEEEWGFTEDDLDKMCDAMSGDQHAMDTLPKAKRLEFAKRNTASQHKRAFYPIFDPHNP